MEIPEIKSKVEENFRYAVEKLKEKVPLQAISNDNFDQNNMQISAEWVAKQFDELGFDTKIVRAKNFSDDNLGRPAVLGTKLSKNPNAPTVLLYAHHDVQPVNSPDDWKTPPFEAIEKDDHLYGRGTTDDGSGIVTHLAAIRLLGDDLPVNLKLLIEGEEEFGSDSMINIIQDNYDLLKADVAIIADSGEIISGVPTITASLRGVFGIQIKIKVLDHDLHSGEFSGPLIDPFILMGKLMASLHDENGEPTVKGLVSYDDGNQDFTEEMFRKDSSIVPSFKLTGSGSVTARLWTKPTFTWIGGDIPPNQSASNTIAKEANATLSVRIAPGQDPQVAYDLVKQHLESVNLFGAELTIQNNGFGPAFQTDLTSKSVKYFEWANQETWGQDTVFAGMGGSIPLCIELQEAFKGMEILVTSAGDPDSRMHSANENLNLIELRKFIEAEALFFYKLGLEGL